MVFDKLAQILMFVARPLALAGELDPFNPPSLAAETIDAIPGDQAKLAIIPGRRSPRFVDNPEFTRDRTSEFLASLW